MIQNDESNKIEKICGQHVRHSMLTFHYHVNISYRISILIYRGAGTALATPDSAVIPPELTLIMVIRFILTA